MNASRISHWELAIITLILAVALLIRLIGIQFGLPYVYFPDEAVIVNHAMAFGTGDLNPHYFLYPSLYMYVMFFIYGITYVAGWITGFFTSTSDFVHLFFTDLTLFYLPGRLIAALSGVISVGIVYFIGRRVYNVRVGLLAAAFLTFSVFHVQFSHYIKTHVPAGMLVIIGLYLALSIYYGNDSWRRYLVSGAVAGLAATTIYHAGFVLMSVVVAHILRWRDFSRVTGEGRLFSPKLFAAIVASFVVFVFGTPFAILDWHTFISDLTTSTAMAYSGGFWERGTFYPFTCLITRMGHPLGLLALLGTVYALLRRRPTDLILLSQPLVVGGFLMLFRMKEPQHMLITYPALSILSASLVVDVVSQFVRPRILQAASLTLVSVLLLVSPAIEAFQLSFGMRLPDTRTVSKDWVEKNIPLGSKIVMDSGKYYLSAFGPPLLLSRWTLERHIARGEKLGGESLARREGNRRVAYTGEAEYFRRYLEALDDHPGYDIIQILHNPGSRKAEVLTLKDYLSMGAEYAIVSSNASERYRTGSETAAIKPEKAAKYRNLYKAFKKRATLLKEFSPSKDLQGPNLRIYRLQQESSIRRASFKKSTSEEY